MATKIESRTPVHLARRLGTFDATMIGVGAMIGAGIFVLTGIASGKAGPAAVLAFGLNGVVTLFTALSYAELSSAIPEAGGGYSFIKKVMPNPVAFISGWMLWFAYVVACSLYAKGFGSYFLEFGHRYMPALADPLIGALDHGGAVAALTIMIGVVFVGVNIIGAQASGMTENVITMAKILILAVFIYFGIKQVMSEPALARDNMTPFMPLGLGGVAAAMGLTFIAFEGYDLIATVSEEVKEPERTIPRAILYSLAITVVVYLLVVFTCLAAVAPAEGLPTWRLLDKYGELGIVQAAQSFMPRFGVILVLGGGLFATLSALNATVLASSRVAFSMGRDWMLPNVLSRVHPRRKTPVTAILLTGFLFLVVAVFLPLETIGTASSLLFLLTFSMVNVALILYRRRGPEDDDRFRVPLYPLTPVLGIVTTLGLALFQLAMEPGAWLLAAGWVAVGLGIFLLFFSKRAAIADVPRIIESPELLDLKRTQRYKILCTLANPARVEHLVELSDWVAEDNRGEVLALSVVEVPDVTAYADAEPLMHSARSLLADAEDLALRQGVPFSTLLKIARSAEDEIVSAAEEYGCDLILMGYKREEDPIENSVIAHVLRHQPCDVAILRSTEGSELQVGRVLVPIGGKTIHDELKARLVHSVRDMHDVPVTIMIVVEPGADDRERQWAEDALRRASRLYRLPDAELVLDEAPDLAQAIAKRARADDLLVLGMQEESWFRAFFFGTVAQRITGQVECATLLTKARAPRRRRVRRVLEVVGRG